MKKKVHDIVNQLHVLSHFRPVRLCATLWTVAHRAPLFLGFSKARMPSSQASCQIRDRTHNISCKAGGFFTTEPPRKPESTIFQLKKKKAPRKVLMIALRPISGASDNSFYFLGLNFHVCKFSIMNILSHSLYLSTVGIQRNITCKK